MTDMQDTPPDLTVQILRQIRDEIVTTRTELSGRIDHVRTQLSDRIDHLSTRVDHLETELSSRIDHLDTTMNELAHQQRFVVHDLRGLGERDRRLEGEVDDLRGRVEALEKRVPG